MTENTRRVLRTVLQSAVGVLTALPALVDAGSVPRSLPWVCGALAVSATLTRLMALPAVQALLPAWLRTADRTPSPTTEGGGRP
ncbi:hypothetical protein ACFV3R_06825 [Streptomyces sp. NPDC059740]|uniref:hypothetical protein n=1 Tax=Streptomyces sp. NPDC059740 TaxID=3346926 RepID=UPI00365AB04F